MEYVKLGNSDIKVSRVCMGCWQFNGNEQSADKTWPAQPEEVSRRIVDKAIECGINFFDTARAYPNSEVVLGSILQGRRKDVILASKLGHPSNPSFTAEDVEKGLTASLANLQTDYLDLYQVHWPFWINDNMQACVDELKRQQAKGRIRQIGVCNFGAKNLKDIIAAGITPVTNQLSYSLLWRPIEFEVLPVCRENNIGVLCYSPLQQGLLSGKVTCLDDVPEGRRRTRLFNSKSTSLSKHGEEGAEKLMFEAIGNIDTTCSEAGVPMASAALSWCLQQNPVQAVIVGASNPGQVEKNARTVKINQNTVDKLSDVTKALKEHFGNTPDLWMNPSRMA